MGPRHEFDWLDSYEIVHIGPTRPSYQGVTFGGKCFFVRIRLTEVTKDSEPNKSATGQDFPDPGDWPSYLQVANGDRPVVLSA